MVLSSKGMPYLQLHENFHLCSTKNFFFFAWGSMSKFPKHWKIKNSKVGDGLTQPVTMQIPAHLMPDRSQFRTFRSSSNTCSWAQGKFLLPGWGRHTSSCDTLCQYESCHPLWPRTLKPTNSHTPRTFWFSARIQTKVKQSPTSTSYSRLFCQLLNYNITFLNWCK